MRSVLVLQTVHYLIRKGGLEETGVDHARDGVDAGLRLRQLQILLLYLDLLPSGPVRQKQRRVPQECPSEASVGIRGKP